MNETTVIQYEVRYVCPEVHGVSVLPMWIGREENPAECAREHLSKICPNGYDIWNIKVATHRLLDNPDFKLCDKYLPRISEILI